MPGKLRLFQRDPVVTACDGPSCWVVVESPSLEIFQNHLDTAQCWSREVGADDPGWSFPNSPILGSCDLG